MYLYILCVLIFLTHQQSLFRLSTKGKSVLELQDFIYSTLGLFRMKLIRQSCQLRIQQFSGIDYRIKGYYPQDAFKIPCQTLILQHGGLRTDHEVLIMKTKYSQTKQYNHATLTLDDYGVIRLTCMISINSMQIVESDTVWVSQFRTPNKYLFPVNDIVINSQDLLQFRQNEGKWGISARNGQFRIFHVDNPTRIVRYKYSGFSLSPGKISDKANRQGPAASIQGFNYEQRCGIVKYMDFKFPLLFIFNSHWPELTVLDQGGYQLLSIKYPNFNCIQDLSINPIEGQKQCIGWICPQGTFQYFGDCVLICPSPYYHQIKNNGKNKCVLMCQQGSTIDESNKICSCGVLEQFSCPTETKEYSLGCYCNNNKFFNKISCSKRCPLGYQGLYLATNYSINSNRVQPLFAFSQSASQFGGVCIKCPYKCLKCDKFGNTEPTYLVCLQCMEGYLVYQGFCKKLNSVVNNQTKCIKQCQKCQGEGQKNQQNIASQVNSKQVEKYQKCLYCIRPYFLYRNTCIKKCPDGYKMKVTQSFHFQCQTIKQCKGKNISVQTRPNFQIQNSQKSFQTSLVTSLQILSSSPSKPMPEVLPEKFVQCQTCGEEKICWINCDKGNYYTNQSSCFCQINTGFAMSYAYGFVENCQLEESYFQWLKDKKQNMDTTDGCPISYYFYRPSRQCLACPFGCLTCISNIYGYVECTSCGHSYFLMIDINWTHFCQRDTSLFPCQQTENNPVKRMFDSTNRVCKYTIEFNKFNTPFFNLYQFQLASLTYSLPNRIRCRKTDVNCLICLEQSSQICTFCATNFFLINGRCVKACPLGTQQHQKICINFTNEKGFQFCRKGRVSQKFYLLNVSQFDVGQQGYQYFLPSSVSRINKVIDPTGNLFTFANFDVRDVGSRISTFPFPVIQCEKCIDFYGINYLSNKCEPCIQKYCVSCPNSIQNMCFKCTNDYKLNQNYVCVEKSLQQKSCNEGQFRNQRNICSKDCKGFWKIDSKNKRKKESNNNNRFDTVNCTDYCNDNEKQDNYFEIFEGRSNKNRSYLICRTVQKQQQNGKKQLSIAGSSYFVDGIRMFVIVPLQSQFVALEEQSILNKLLSINYIEIGNSQLGKKFQQVPQSYIVYKKIENKKITIGIRNKLDCIYSVGFDVRKFYGKVEDYTYASQRLLAEQGYNKMENNRQSFIYLGQSQYVLPNDLKYSFSSPLQSYSKIALILVFMISLWYIGLDTLYKVDNLLIILQVLPLFLLSIDIHMIDQHFYALLGGFNWAIGGLPQQLFEEHALQNNFSTGMALLSKDPNILRNCWILFLLIAVALITYLFVGILCMKTQIFVCWRRATKDRQISPNLDSDFIKQKNEIKSRNNYNYKAKKITKQILNQVRFDQQQYQFKKQEHEFKITENQVNSQQKLREQNKNVQIQDQANRIKQKIKGKYLDRSILKTANTNTKTQPNYRLKNNNNKIPKGKKLFKSKIEETKQMSNSNQLCNDAEPASKYSTMNNIRTRLNNQWEILSTNFIKYNPIDINHMNKLKHLLTLTVQWSSLPIIYFSILTLLSSPIHYYNHLQLQQQQQYKQQLQLQLQQQGSSYNFINISKIISLIWIVFYVVYAVVRIGFDVVGGLYMLKRILLAVVLGFVLGCAFRFVYAIPVQILFAFARIYIQEAYTLVSLSKNYHTAQQDNKNQHKKVRQPLEQKRIKRLNSNKPILPLSSIQKTGGQKINKSSNQMRRQKMGQSNEYYSDILPGLLAQDLQLGGNVNAQQINQNKLNLNPNQNQNNSNEHKDKKEKQKHKQKFWNSFQQFLSKLTLKIKPYHRLLSLVIEQLLIIILFALLSMTDYFVKRNNQYHYKNKNMTNPQGYHIGLVLTIALIVLIISCYIFNFITEFVSILIQKWELRRLSDREKSNKLKFIKHLEMLQLIQKKQKVFGTNLRLERSQSKITDKYIEYYNQFTYQIYDDESYLNLAGLESDRLQRDDKQKQDERLTNQQDQKNKSKVSFGQANIAQQKGQNSKKKQRQKQKKDQQITMDRELYEYVY